MCHRRCKHNYNFDTSVQRLVPCLSSSSGRATASWQWPGPTCKLVTRIPGTGCPFGCVSRWGQICVCGPRTGHSHGATHIQQLSQPANASHQLGHLAQTAQQSHCPSLSWLARTCCSSCALGGATPRAHAHHLAIDQPWPPMPTPHCCPGAGQPALWRTQAGITPPGRLRTAVEHLNTVTLAPPDST
jgi:hypothetical protein